MKIEEDDFERKYPAIAYILGRWNKGQGVKAKLEDVKE